MAKDRHAEHGAEAAAEERVEEKALFRRAPPVSDGAALIPAHADKSDKVNSGKVSGEYF